YIRCADCKSTVDLCTECFAKGTELGGHKKTHAYRVVDKLETPVYTDDWTAAEELSLADYTRTQGLGSYAWRDLPSSVR
ncbi:unnamed protein product, partial [Laminaria digitata]